MQVAVAKWRNWFATVKKDCTHSASGTRYCVQGPISWKTYALSLMTPELQVVLLYRIYSAIYHAGMHLPAIVIYLLAKFMYKCDIHPKSSIGAGFLLVHAFDIVVGADVRMGSNVVLFNGVSLGKKHSGVIGAGMPQVGNDCLFGTGAKILGGVVIGNNVTIGANSVVLQDVENGVTCAGNPARVLQKA